MLETVHQQKQTTYYPPAPKPLQPHEGLGALHLFYRVNLPAWRAQPEADRRSALTELENVVQAARAEVHSTVVTLSMLARADLGFMILMSDVQLLNSIEKQIAASLGPNVLEPVYTYLSFTERSEYTQKDEDYALEIEKEDKIMRGTPESEAKIAEFRERIALYRHERLYPNLPPWEYFCFYPMSKRRGAEQNWYALDFETRRKLMGGHMRVGRTFAGRVRQLVTGSTGTADWEWGVSLFAHDPADIKQIVYEMRFDEVSHQYAEFGPFFNGLPMPLRDIYARLLLA